MSRIVYTNTNQINLRNIRKKSTGYGGLSGEHIQLCAEGARWLRLPNLSGKRTEMRIYFAIRVSRQSRFGAAYFVW